MICKNGFLWAWLPGQAEPTLAGVILFDDARQRFLFQHTRSYLTHRNRMTFTPAHLQVPRAPEPGLPSFLTPLIPGQWARDVIMLMRHQALGVTREDSALWSPLDFLLMSSNNGPGSVQLTQDKLNAPPLTERPVSLSEALPAAYSMMNGHSLSLSIPEALRACASFAGAWPKALIREHDGEWVAKFSIPADPYDTVRFEALLLSLAQAAGLRVPEFKVTEYKNLPVLMTRRIDRTVHNGRIYRNHLISARALFDAPSSHHASSPSYGELSRWLRWHGQDPEAEVTELFRRLIFSLMTGHRQEGLDKQLLLWDGDQLRLAPLVGLSPCLDEPEHQPQLRLAVIDECFEARYDSLLPALGLFGIDRTRMNFLWNQMCEILNDELSPQAQSLGITPALLTHYRNVCWSANPVRD